MTNKLSKVEELQLTHNAFEQLKNKLKQTHQEYKGISSMAAYLVNYYFALYYDSIYPNEYEYFKHYKVVRLYWEVLGWLSKDWRLRGIKIKKLLAKADEELKKEKEKIYSLWKNSRLNKTNLTKYMKDNIENADNDYYKHRYMLKYKMIKDLIRYYPKFDKDNIIDFKKDIGLC